MSLDRRLEAWLRAGIIDEETSNRIRAFEDKHKRPTALYALVGLGALAIGIGFVAIVAANWDAIPPAMKLGADLLIGAGLAFGIERGLRRGGGWGAEALLMVYYLFVLASIGLLGQLYQLGSPLHLALGLWSLATLPLLFLTRSRFAGLLWASGLITTYVANTIPWVERVEESAQLDVALSLGLALPTLLFVSSLLLRPGSEKAARTFRELAWVLLVGGSFAGSFFWYPETEPKRLVTWGAGIAIAVAAVPVFFRKSLFDKHARLAMVSLMAFALTVVVPLVVPHGRLELVGGLVGLAVLGFFAFVAYSISHRAAFGVLTAVIGIRIVTLYFEVFGSLMSTGLGLLTGGVLTLLVAWLWSRTSSGLEDDFHKESSHAE